MFSFIRSPGLILYIISAFAWTCGAHPNICKYISKWCTANFRRTIAALPYIFYDISKSIHHTEMFQLSSESWHQDVSNEWCSIAVRSLLSPQRPKMYLGWGFFGSPFIYFKHIQGNFFYIFICLKYRWCLPRGRACPV